jgi:hypothetical protein
MQAASRCGPAQHEAIDKVSVITAVTPLTSDFVTNDLQSQEDWTCLWDMHILSHIKAEQRRVAN